MHYFEAKMLCHVFLSESHTILYIKKTNQNNQFIQMSQQNIFFNAVDSDGFIIIQKVKMIKNRL